MNTFIKNMFNKIKLKINAGVYFFYKKFIKPKSVDEDHKRREFILNTLLMCTLFLYSLSFLTTIYCDIKANDTCNGQENFTIFPVFILFLILYLISRFKSYRLSAYLFIIIFLVPILYATYIWGADLSAVLLFSVLLIIMSSIVIGTHFSFFITSVISTAFIVLTILQTNNIIAVDRTWKNGKEIGLENIFIYMLTFLIIVTISWLSNREIEKSLERARKSETKLKEERDLLEIKVKERTKDLERVQMEKMKEVSRLAEFGRLSSGLFHDLINPLTALSFNVEKIKKSQNDCHLREIEKDLDEAFIVTKKMRQFIKSIHKQTHHKENKELFSLNQEIDEVVRVLTYKAQKNNIQINTSHDKEIKILGDPVRFSQIILNLVSNAIDSYPLNNEFKKIDISLCKNKDCINLYIKDYGKGIPKKVQNKIFTTFFTTKENGTGVGLSLVKNIIEKDFNGRIYFKTSENKGTTFIIKLNP